jgi:hypothetical protein
MAKKSKCEVRRCLTCKWWPKVRKYMGKSQCYFWVNSQTGEVMIATGLRALPDGGTVKMEPINDWVDVECDCGTSGVVRSDLLESGFVERCVECSAECAQAERN